MYKYYHSLSHSKLQMIISLHVIVSSVHENKRKQPDIIFRWFQKASDETNGMRRT